MENIELDKILQAIPSLSYTDTKRLNRSVKKKLDSDVVGKVISDREECVSECPHCNRVEFCKHGVTSKGIQRYRCKGCKRTFCSLTNTPLYKMRKEDKWLEYVSMMWEGVALRKIAKTLKINLRTAFFWRHRLLSDGCCLCTDGNVSYKSIVKDLDINLDHKRIIASDGRVIDGVYHIQHVNGFISLWKEWLNRFRGVGTAYVSRYLAWYIWMQDKSYGEEDCWLREASQS